MAILENPNLGILLVDLNNIEISDVDSSTEAMVVNPRNKGFYPTHIKLWKVWASFIFGKVKMTNFVVVENSMDDPQV